MGVYEHPCVGMKEIKRKERDFVPTSANYSRFSDYFSEWCLCPGGAYAPSNTVVVWATKLLLAAIGLVFPALVLGYKNHLIVQCIM